MFCRDLYATTSNVFCTRHLYVFGWLFHWSPIQSFVKHPKTKVDSWKLDLKVTIFNWLMKKQTNIFTSLWVPFRISVKTLCAVVKFLSRPVSEHDLRQRTIKGHRTGDKLPGKLIFDHHHHHAGLLACPVAQLVPVAVNDIQCLGVLFQNSLHRVVLKSRIRFGQL